MIPGLQIALQQTILALPFCFGAAIAPAMAEIRSLPVPAATIYPDDVITPAMLAERRFRVTAISLRGFVTDPGIIVGKLARRRLVAGKPIPLVALVTPVAVRRGAEVIAVYEEDGFSITSGLIALQDGATGGVIAARNPSSGVVVRAVVQPDGTLLVAGE